MSKPTGRARELGASLRFQREQAEWSEKRVAEFLEISQGQLCRIEQGSRSISDINVARCLTLYGVSGAEFEEIIALAREVDDCYRIRAHNDRLPDELRTLIHYESTASRIDTFEPSLIPGLLQTENYARAVFRWGALFPEEGIETRIEARMDRQKLLNANNRPWFRFFIHEHALAPAVIGAEIMRDQLMFLMLACNWDGCEIRIVPAEAGPITALSNGSFFLMSFGDLPPAVYVESACTSQFLEAPEVVERYGAIVKRLANLALPQAESQRRFASLAT